MNKNKMTALMLAGLLTAVTGSAFAGSTGPTNPVDTTPKTPASGIEKKNTDGTSTNPPGTSPGVKGMDPEPKIDGASGTGNGMPDGQNKGDGSKGNSSGAGGSGSGG